MRQLRSQPELARSLGFDELGQAEVRVTQRLPDFHRRRQYKTLYDVNLPNSENMVYFNSKFESGNLKQAV